jgi:hypothetical protein
MEATAKRIHNLVFESKKIPLDESYIIQFLENSELRSRDDKTLANALYDHFLTTDLNSNKALKDTFHKPIHQTHNETLKGPHVLQIDSIVNISENWEQQDIDKEARVLKLNGTDGFQRIYGMEYHRVPDLSIRTPPGVKVSSKQ